MFRQRILTVEKRLVSEAWTSFKRFEWRYDIPATDEGQPIFVSDDAVIVNSSRTPTEST